MSVSEKLATELHGYRPTSKYNRRFGIINGLLAATLITGTNWYLQKKWAESKIAKEDRVIQRINSGETTTLSESTSSVIVSRGCRQRAPCQGYRGQAS